MSFIKPNFRHKFDYLLTDQQLLLILPKSVFFVRHSASLSTMLTVTHLDNFLQNGEIYTIVYFNVLLR